MWPRKQLDIGWRDLAFGLIQVGRSRTFPSTPAVVGDGWMPADEAVVTLSVRTGWDLLLTALALPAGSEVLVSAVTIADMVRIIEHHGLVPVAVDVDATALEIDIDQLERFITPQTRLILIAHLFGSRMDMASITELARRYDLLVVEDCAQAFVGLEYAGHAASDCVMFSFGPIKTATALGGAVIRVRDERLRERMEALQRGYPLQNHWSYLKRVIKYIAFRVVSVPGIYGQLMKAMQFFRIEYDRALANAAHSFGADKLFVQLRQRPCAALARMLQRRICGFDRAAAARLLRRRERGDALPQTLPAGMVVGDRNNTHTYWVLPIRVANADEVIATLRAAGFDATARSSMIAVPRKSGTASISESARWLQDVVYLPSSDHMSEAEWRRLITILMQVARLPSPRIERELVTPRGVLRE